MPQEINEWEIISLRREKRAAMAADIRELRKYRSASGKQLIPNSAIRAHFAKRLAHISEAFPTATVPAQQRWLRNFISNYPRYFVFGKDVSHLPCGEDDYRGEVLDARVRQFYEEFQILQALVSDEFYRERRGRY